MAGASGGGRVSRKLAASLLLVWTMPLGVALATRSPLTRASKSSAAPAASTTAAPAAAVPSAQMLLERAAKTMERAKSYRAEARAAIRLGAAPVGSAPGQALERKISIAFAKPLKMAIESEVAGVYCDGKSLWTAIKLVKQYRVMPAPPVSGETTDLKKWLQSIVPGANLPDGLPSSAQEWNVQVAKVLHFDGVTAESLEGRVGWRLAGTIQPPKPPGLSPVPFTIWFDGGDGVPREALLEMRQPAPAGGVRNAMPGMTISVRVDKLDLDAAIPDSGFVYSPPVDYKKVEQFDFRAQAPEKNALVGKPAPAIEGKDLAGEKVSLAGLRGRVVVLDFWATWCPPCVRAIPHVQTLVERFQTRSVTVLGVNQDREGGEAKVLKFLKSKAIRFRQMMDQEGEIGGKYAVTAIPCTVVIDAKGVVRHVQTGFNPSSEEEIAGLIETLLKE
ncbi:MAG: TlpA family protein disulfide reductase [Candidatus Wallbacteria bacterium]|nr:TlpA family protein disulfide reductase [Candidatus Wallbacteria bacterium]